MPHKKTMILAALSVMAALMFLLENFIPKPFPFLRLGLANIFILLLIAHVGWKEAFVVALAKTLLGSLMSGLIFTPVVLFSLVSTLVSFFVMVLLCKLPFKCSLIGISIAGAVCHNMAQLGVAYMIYIKNESVFSLTPWLLLLGLVTGFITGLIAEIIQHNDRFVVLITTEKSKG